MPRIIPGIDSTQARIRPVIAVEFDPTKPDLSRAIALHRSQRLQP
ncbi:hypothetical protein [Nostoc sp.]